jgi:hypothetical protein
MDPVALHIEPAIDAIAKSVEEAVRREYRRRAADR